MNYFLAGRTLSYFLFSRHKWGHGIHSPFIFNLFSEIFENKKVEPVVKSVEIYRESLLDNNNIVRVKDLGSGSLKMGERSRRISDIARYSSTRKKYTRILSALAISADGEPVFELGTSLGIGALTLALSAPGSKITTMEGCPETAAVAREYFRKMGINNIDSRIGDIGAILEETVSEPGSPPRLVFIDANHNEEALTGYFDVIARYAGEDTVIVIDDIHLSGSMEAGWNRIKRDDRARVTIDILQMGLIFFRSGLTKEDHVIRY